jgi:signal peptidase II
MARLPLAPVAFGAVAAVTLLLDQAAKLAVVWGGLAGPAPVIPGFFELLYRENRGGAWGLLSGAPEWFRLPFFVGTSVLAIAFLLWLRGRMRVHRPWVDVAFPAILGGAVGNLIDRVRLGFVVDFLDLHVGAAHWPTFNVADIGITVGVALLVADSLFVLRRPAADGAPTTPGPTA